jgi:potassium-dependent mechanosensitive channel
MKFVMKKKILFILLLLVVCLLPTHAVLKEANLDTTLFMLRTELTQYHIDLEKQNRMAKAQQQAVIKELIHIMMRTSHCDIIPGAGLYFSVTELFASL